MTRALRCIFLALALGLAGLGFHPGDAQARQTMSFSPGTHARVHVARAPRHGRAGRVRGGRRASVPRRAPSHGSRQVARQRGGDDEGDAARAVPGKGFTMENGVLTYPAPARFQPRNLKPR